MNTNQRYMQKMILRQLFRRSPGGVVTTILLLGILILLGRTGVFGPVSREDRTVYDGVTATVVHVADGDTLDIDIYDSTTGKNKTRIRLWGVDTPETKHPTVGVMYFGPEASDYAKKTLLGKEVTVRLESTEKARDKYGRLLGYVYLADGGMFNEMLIENGYGYADRRFRHEFKDRFIKLEKRAKEGKVGLWEAVRTDQLPEWYIRIVKS